ncbi:uncharacterized protein LOC118185425 [Stegodyphus dumicola]|uniref:uncharacterized protein LOC118185425 n=1 Tax=Stegodyphus dumicola TaxID=202533 RepID=UPI0015B1BE9E|nr:uncharacterized protein LOC118185425 [Stegodyphus dumicola]
MHTPQEKAQILWWFHRNEFRNATTEKLQIPEKKRYGRPCTSDFDVERVRETFFHNPRRFVRSAARELDMPISTVYKVIKKKLRLHAYEVQIEVLEPDERPRRMAFATDMLRRIEDYAEFLKRIMFPDEASFHLSGIINRHNVRISGSENSHEYREA